jgi:hypothetical protein
MRFEYRDWVLGIDPHNLVFVDESVLKLGMTRLYRRAKSGERLHDCCRGKNLHKTRNPFSFSASPTIFSRWVLKTNGFLQQY